MLLRAACALADEDDGTDAALPGFQFSPETIVYYRVNPQFRTLLDVTPTFQPSVGYSELALSAYGDWMLAPLFRSLLNPDESKARKLQLRSGFKYFKSIDSGQLGNVQLFALQDDVAPRFLLPSEILLTWRNRFEARWDFANRVIKESWRARTRTQFERAFLVGPQIVTPFVSGELLVRTPDGPLNQFRWQAGIGVAGGEFAHGQAVVFTYTQAWDLQKGVVDRRVLGLALHVFL